MKYQDKVKKSKIKDPKIKQLMFDIIGSIIEKINLLGVSFLREEITLMKS